MEIAFHKMLLCHSLAIGHRKICNETAFYKMCNVTHILLVIGKHAFHRLCNVTHILLVMGENVMRLPFMKCAMSLTFYWSKGKM